MCPDIEHTGFRVHGSPTPVTTTGDSRDQDRAAQRWRGKQRAMIVASHDIHRFLVDLRRQIDQVLVTQSLHVDRRRLGRKRLGFRCALAGHAGGRDGLLFDWPYGPRPVTRSNTYTKACLVTCATALISVPSTVMSIRLGAAGVS